MVVLFMLTHVADHSCGTRLLQPNSAGARFTALLIEVSVGPLDLVTKPRSYADLVSDQGSRADIPLTSSIDRQNVPWAESTPSCIIHG